MQFPEVINKVTPQWVTTTIAVLGAMTGALGMGIRQWVKLSQLEDTVKELKQANLHVRLTTLEQLVNDIRVSISKLSVLDAISAKQELTINEIRDIRSQMVPRSEYNARMDIIEDRLAKNAD